jgi:hypothetical protein
MTDTNHNELGETLNSYGQVAQHEDCGDHDQPGRGKCSGWMGYWENPNTGNHRLLCAHHSDLAERRQAQIHRDYLNDGVYSPDY